MALGERFAGRSVAEVLQIQAAESPDATFLIYQDRRLTFSQVDARATALAAALAELELGLGLSPPLVLGCGSCGAASLTFAGGCATT